MAFDDSKWVWQDGEIVPWADATVHVSAHALHYGTGVFEGIRCYATERGAAIFRLDAHLQRFFASAAVHGLEIPYSAEQLTAAICELIARNGFSECYVRPICYFGSRALGLNPRGFPVHTSILVWPWETMLGKKALEQGIRVTVSPWVKFHSSMMPTTAKACGQYLNSVLAIRDASARGFDEALLLNRDGSVSECSGENVFLVHGGKLFTNDAADSILMGVTRDAVIQLARSLGIAVETRALQLSDLVSADEAFLTGTAAEVTPVRELDGQPIGDGARGPVTSAIQSAFFAAVAGRTPEFAHWLHPVAPAGVELVTNVTR